MTRTIGSTVILELALTLGLMALIAAIGVVLERRVRRKQPLVSVPRWVATPVAGIALMGPFILHMRDLLAVPVIHDLVGAFALSSVGWLLAIRLVGLDPGGTTC